MPTLVGKSSHRLQDRQEPVDACERAVDQEINDRMAELYFQVREIRECVAKLDFELHTQVSQMRNDLSKIVPQAGSSPKMSKEPSLVEFETTMDFADRKRQSVLKETPHWPSMRLGDGLLEMLKPEGKVAEFVKSTVHLTVRPLKEELATLQKRVTQLSDPQQETEEHMSMKDNQPSAFQPATELSPLPESEEGVQAQLPGAMTGSSTTMPGGVSTASVASLDKVMMFEYDWQESIWDVSMFIGSKRLGRKSSLATAICLVLYLILCAALVLESGDAVSVQNFGADTRGEFQYWRSTVAHDLSFRNPVTGESLASSVCNQRMYVPYATLQQGAAGILSEYLEGHPVFGTTVKRGVLMCTLALSVWILKISEELGDALDFALGCLHLPISKSTTFKGDVTDPSVAELVSISPVRSVIMMALFTARILVAIALMWSGSVFLIQETSLTDMVLNAMAMEMILDLDELIFAALLPKKPTMLIKKIKPLKFRLRNRETCLAWQRLAHVLLVIVSGVFIKMLYLDPFVDELQKNLDALCGGFDDSSFEFVMKVDSIGIPWATATSHSRNMAETYAQYAVSEVIKFGFPRPAVQLRGKQRANLGLFMQMQSAFDLENYMVTQNEFKGPESWTIFNAREMTTVFGWNEALLLGDADFGDGPGTVYNRYLQFLLGASGKVSCADVPLHKCYESGDEGLVMRKLCPSWCGCDLPTGGTISNAVAGATKAKLVFPGCPSWVTGKRRFRETLRDLPCVDTIRSDVFIPWLQGIGDYRVPQASGLLADQLLASFESGGCDAVAYANLGREGARICAESSLPAVCPVSCGCDESVNWTKAHAWRMDYCPQSCGRLQSFTCLTISVKHTVDTGSNGPYVDFPCVFPFTHKSKTYNKCTTDDWHVPWCAVTLKEGLSYQWGDCPPGC